MTHPVLVVGGGFWGVAISAVLQRSGWSVCLIEAGHRSYPDGASRAASGYVSLRWFHDIWAPRAVEALQTAQLFGLEFRQVTALRVPSSKLDTSWNIFSPDEYLNLYVPDVYGVVTRVFRGPSAGVLLESGLRLSGQSVVVCAGAATDKLLRTSALPPIGIRPLRGSAAYIRGASALQADVVLHEVNPYRHVALRAVDSGLIRVCATVERAADPGGLQVQRMLGSVNHLLGGGSVERVVSGVRPVRQEGPCVREVAPGVIAASGGGRVGALLGWWAAERVVDLLKRAK